MGTRQEHRRQSPYKHVRRVQDIRQKDNIPLDSKASDSWLLSEDVAADLLEDRLGWWISVQLLRIVLVVDIVSNPNELSTIVGASEEDDSDTKDFGIRDSGGIGGFCDEDELVYTDWDGSNKETVQLLVMLIPKTISYAHFSKMRMEVTYEVAEPT